MPNHQAFSCRFEDGDRNLAGVIQIEHTLQLCEQAIQQPKVPLGHSRDPTDDVLCESFLW